MISLSEFKQMLDMAPCGMGLFRLGGNGNSTYLNDTYYQLIGYTREEYEKFCDKPNDVLIHPEDRGLVAVQEQSLIRCGKAEAEYRIIRKNGDICWVKLSASTMEIEGSEMIFSTFTDITHQKNLISHMELIASQVGSSISVLQIENNKQTPLFTNDEFYRMIGVTRDEYAKDPQKYDFNAVSEKDRKRIAAAVEKALITGNPIDVEYWLRRPDKTSIYVLRKATVLQKTVENTFLLLSVVLDITAKKKENDQIAFEQERYRLVLEKINAAIMDWNYQTGEFYCSESYKKYALSAVDEKTILENEGPGDMVFADDIPELKKFFEAKGKAFKKSECVVRLKMIDGTFRWSRLLGFTSYNPAGKAIRSIGAILDINDDVEKTFIMDELINALPGGMGIFKCGQNPECIYFNKAFEHFSERTAEELQRLFNTPGFARKTVLASDWSLFEAEVLCKIKAGLPINCNFRYYKSSSSHEKTIGWLHLSATKIREEDGLPVYYGIFIPPSDENKLFKQMSENSLVAELVIEFSSDIVLSANRAMKLLAGYYNNENLIGRSIDELFSLANAEMLRVQLLQLTIDEYREFIIKTEDGRSLLMRGRIIDWNGRPASMLYFLDQTDIQQQNEQLENLLNSVPGGVGIFEVSGGRAELLYLNNGFFNMLHDTRENRKEFYNTHFFNSVFNEDRPRVKEAITLIASGGACTDITFRILDGRQNYVWMRFIGSSCKKSDERVLVYCSFFNVDDRIKEQLTLKNNQIVLSRAMQAANMSTWEYSIEDKCLYQDLFSQKQHGYGGVVENAPESFIEDGAIHPDSVEDFRSLFRKVPERNEVMQKDCCVKTKGRNGFWWERIIMTPVFDADGSHVRSIGISIDVTRQKMLEEKYNRQMQELISANSPDLIAKGVYNLTENTVENYYAQTENAVDAADVLSYDDGLNGTAELFVNDDAKAEFLHDFAKERLLEQFDSGNLEATAEYLRRAKNGNIIWARTQCKLFAVPSTGDIMCFIYSYDITQQRTNREMIDAVVRLDYDYIALLDCRTKEYTVFANDVAGKSPLPPFHSANYEEEVREYAEKYVLPSEIDRNISEMSIQNIISQLKNNESYVIYVTVIEESGQFSRKKLQFSYLDRANERVLLTRTDITEMYRQEQMRLAEVNTAMEAAKTAAAAKSSFLSRMSHDLRTPMNAIVGLTALARDEVCDPAAMRSYVSNISSASDILLSLINDCLDLEKITANKMVLNPTVYPCDVFEKNITSVIKPLCDGKNITFVIKLKPLKTTVFVDAVRLNQIFINLLTNAVKFTPNGGQVELLCNGTTTDGKVVFADFIVRDNGIGMSKEFQTRMFEPFEQETNEVSSNYRGTGLGLPIVKSLIELMNGSISVKSTPGQGTEFTVRLAFPIAETPANYNKIPLEHSFEEKLCGKHILVIEDHPLNMEIAKRLLEKKKMLVTCAFNGKVGLNVFSKSSPGTFDAILMDVRMPVMNGLEAAAEIRKLSREDAKNLPIIAMTANAFDEDKRACASAGMDVHLAKPIDPEILYKTLFELL